MPLFSLRLSVLDLGSGTRQTDREMANQRPSTLSAPTLCGRGIIYCQMNEHFRWKYSERIQRKTETTRVDSGFYVVELDRTEPHSEVFQHT